MFIKKMVKMTWWKMILVFLLVLLLIIFLIKSNVKEGKTVTIGNTSFYVEVARTVEEKAKGLAGHKPLADNEGMLFEFPAGDGFGFWMKGMTFPIDIIWIKNNKVIYVVENTQPPKPGQKERELPIFTPPEGAEYVLEVKAGEVKKTNLKINDQVKIQL